MKRGMLVAFVGCFLLLASTSVSADQVFMKNGDQITGEIKHMAGGKLFFKPKYAKLMEIDWKEVVGLSATHTVVNAPVAWSSLMPASLPMPTSAE